MLRESNQSGGAESSEKSPAEVNQMERIENAENLTALYDAVCVLAKTEITFEVVKDEPGTYQSSKFWRAQKRNIESIDGYLRTAKDKEAALRKVIEDFPHTPDSGVVSMEHGVGEKILAILQADAMSRFGISVSPRETPMDIPIEDNVDLDLRETADEVDLRL